MKITYSGGDLITNGHELLVKLNSTTLITLRALTEDLKFLAQPPMIIAHGGGVKACTHDDPIEGPSTASAEGQQGPTAFERPLPARAWHFASSFDAEMADSVLGPHNIEHNHC